MVSGAGSEGGERRAGAGESGGSGARVRDTGPSRRVRPEGAGAAPRGQGPGTGARAGPLVTVTFSPSEAPVRGARRRSYRRRRGSLSVDEKPVRREQPPPLSSPGRICPPPPIAPSHGPPQPAGSRFRTLTSVGSLLSPFPSRGEGALALDASGKLWPSHTLLFVGFHSPGFHCCSLAQSCSTLCTPVDRSTPGSPVLHSLPEFARIHVH